MAIDAPLLTRQRVLAAKAETTTGTAESLAAGQGVFNVFDPSLTPNVEMVDRPGQSALSRLPSVHGTRSGSLTFATMLDGDSGWADTFLLACGFSKSTATYKPATGASDAPTITAGLFEDGRYRAIAGAVGTVTMTFSAGQPVRCEWEFTGKLVTPVAAAIIAPTYPTTIPPRFATASLTVGSASYKVSQMSITLNATISPRHDQDDATGLHSFVITDRNVQINIDPEAVAFGTKNWYTDWFAHSEMALACQVGSSAGNIVSIACPKIQVVNIEPGDRDGIMTDQLTLQANRSASAGDDEISFTLS